MIEINCKTQDSLHISDLTEFQGELKHREESDIKKIVKSIKKHGFCFPFFVWSHDGINHVFDGHGRLLALKWMQSQGEEIPALPVVFVKAKNEADAKELLLKLNSNYGKMSQDSVIEFLDGINIDFNDIALPDTTIEFDTDPDDKTDAEDSKDKLRKEFIAPPLSVLDTTQGYWVDRKRMWKEIGLKSDEGRDDNMLKSMASLSAKSSQGSANIESIFDPVLCEILYEWFCPKDGLILDPFAGGSVRGIIASYRNRQYLGFDIRKEQIEANEEQLDICDGNQYEPKWICLDSAKMDDHLPPDYQTDFVFSCPPYADLEVYSNIDGDISNMKYEDFKKVYTDIIHKACAHLKDDRFACFVVGEVREKKSGYYYNFVTDTIRAFEDAGLHFYDDIVLRTQISAKCLTAAKSMNTSRKVGKVHQNVLVFVKGDPRKATENVGDIEVMEMKSEDEISA